MQIHPFFLHRMQDLLKEEYPEFERSLQEPAVSGLRVNLLKIDPESLKRRLDFALKPVPWCPAGFILKSESTAAKLFSPGKTPEHAAGLYYLQDPSAMAVAEILNPQPGERVLDLAAAPGGKSTHIVSLMKNQGILVSNEIRSQRAWELAENLERWGATNTMITQESPSRLADELERFFDRVLVDAPCSGEGMFRKSENARRDWSPELVNSCSLRQKAILSEAARMVRPGGTLVYATCTFSEEENEGVISHFVEKHFDFVLDEIELVTDSSTNMPGTLRMMPHRIQGEGHFIARMRRKGGAIGDQGITMKREKLPMPALKSYQEFCREAGIHAVSEDRLHLSGSYLYRTVETAPDLSSLQVIHPGLWLGTIHQSERKQARFVPSHAYALAMKPDEVSQTAVISGQEIIDYLKGMPISYPPGEDGWVLVCLDQYPLGWGKRTQGIIKNYYPKGLRRH